jgi:hypothetical protein
LIVELSITRVDPRTLRFLSKVDNNFRGYGTFVYCRPWKIASSGYPSILDSGKHLQIAGRSASSDNNTVQYTYESEQECEEALEFFTTAVYTINRNRELLCN